MKKSYIVDSWPCIAEIFIFLCFRFVEWRDEISPRAQYRVFWGALAIALFFAVFYVFCFFEIKKNYTGEDKLRQYLKVIIFMVIGFSSYLISYFVGGKY